MNVSLHPRHPHQSKQWQTIATQVTLGPAAIFDVTGTGGQTLGNWSPLGDVLAQNLAWQIKSLSALRVTTDELLRCLMMMITSVKRDDNTDSQVVSTPVRDDQPQGYLFIPLGPSWVQPLFGIKGDKKPMIKRNSINQQTIWRENLDIEHLLW